MVGNGRERGRRMVNLVWKECDWWSADAMDGVWIGDLVVWVSKLGLMPQRSRESVPLWIGWNVWLGRRKWERTVADDSCMSKQWFWCMRSRTVEEDNKTSRSWEQGLTARSAKAKRSLKEPPQDIAV